MGTLPHPVIWRQRDIVIVVKARCKTSSPCRDSRGTTFYKSRKVVYLKKTNHYRDCIIDLLETFVKYVSGYSIEYSKKYISNYIRKYIRRYDIKYVDNPDIFLI